MMITSKNPISISVFRFTIYYLKVEKVNKNLIESE